MNHNMGKYGRINPRLEGMSFEPITLGWHISNKNKIIFV